jgi:DNA-binding CsgD family transcriptional regulator
VGHGPAAEHDEEPPQAPEHWEVLVAIGAVARDLSPAGIARFAQVSHPTAVVAIAQARDAGAIDDAGRLDALTGARLVAGLPPRRATAVHTAAAQRAIGGEPDGLRLALDHLQEAAALLPTDEVVALADRAGRLALDVADADAASGLLTLALEHDLTGDLITEADRNLALAQARVLCGDTAGAQARLLRAIVLAEECGEPSIAVRAAERLALPADWQAGDARVVGVLRRVQHMPGLSEEDRTRLLAVRAWVEARLPIARVDEHQVSWVGRPSVARPLAEEAVTRSASQSAATRLLALLAWRHTHRAPQFLERRRDASAAALALAERIDAPIEQVEAAVMLAVDHLEAGDPLASRSALTAAAAVAGRSADPRLRWRALMPAAGAAFLQDDPSAGWAIAQEAFEAGGQSHAPGLVASQWVLTGQLATRHDDERAIAAALDVDRSVIAKSALARAGLALLLARGGESEEASVHAWATLSQLDEESSLLLTLALLADAAVALNDAKLARELCPSLEPWSGRMVVDGNGWWCDGPVDLWLAELQGVGGDGPDAVAARLEAAERLARNAGDARSLRRIAALQRSSLEGGLPRSVRTRLLGLDLTDREIEVLEGLAAGATYRQLAERLRYSVSTVRNDAVAIYRKLGVRGRSEAAARAVSLGIPVGTWSGAG